MTPMVFWASLEPWPRPRAAADTSCRLRNVRLTPRGRRIPWTIQLTRMTRIIARARPMRGVDDEHADLGQTAGDEDVEAGLGDGGTRDPADQRVRRGGRQPQVGGDDVPDDGADEPVTATESTSGSTTPVAMVAATLVPNTAKARKLNRAAQATARAGPARVATTVAIELAASWKPLTKSKPSDDDHDEQEEGLHWSATVGAVRRA